MTIDKNTYWYVKKFLAHKVAFEYGLKMYRPESSSLVEYTRGTHKSLKEISKEVGVEEEVLASYNKWLKTKRIPNEKYVVIVPLKSVENVQVAVSQPNKVAPDFDRVQQTIYPTVVESESPFLVTVNSLEGILAPKGSTLASLAQQGDVSVKELVKYNELEPGQKIVEDQIYYLEKKRNRGKIYFHTVEEGESIWSISQKYGIKAKNIVRFNRLEEDVKPEDGLVLWLHKKRPADLPVVYRPVLSNDLKIVASDGQTESRDLPSSSEIFEREVEKMEAEVDLVPVLQPTEDTVKIAFEEEVVPEQDELVENGEPEYQPAMAAIDTTNVDLVEEKDTVMNASLSEKAIIHKVGQGETLFSIAKKYGISVNELQEWNRIEDVNSLKMDQELTILKESRELNNDLTKSYTRHIVISGDTMYRISKLYNVSLNDLLKWNNKNSSELQVGETLLIKKDSP